ncbi:MAG: tRNA pseudouridine(55) synthase TruB [Acidobacteria bacterium]|nr:tRNA pseudouridine(55) synthase TruB [Acidobacteriota bacterium]
MNSDGLLIIDKPAGLTSHDVVARVRRILKTRRVGHTGTLDPFATGVLVVCVNRATRLAQFLAGEEKEYLARQRLGFATDTGDLTGTPLSAQHGYRVDAESITRADVESALGAFRGRITQLPPMHSAKKVKGVKLYELARRGVQIERAPIEVEIRQLELCASNDVLPLPESADAGLDRQTVDYTFRVVCSAGAYIRTLAEDIGQRLGCGAHLVALRRTRAGRFGLERAVTLERLAELAESGAEGDALIPMRDALGFPEIRLSAAEVIEVGYGREIERRGEWADGSRGRMCKAAGELLAVGEYDAGRGRWRPRVVLAE